MSAFICDNKTISALVKAFIEYEVPFTFDYCSDPLVDIDEERNRIGQKLLEQNYKSVNDRYSENYPTPTFEYNDVEIDEGIVYGCMSCYEYQACESDDYEDSLVHYCLQRLHSKLLVNLLGRCHLVAPYGYGGHDMLCY